MQAIYPQDDVSEIETTIEKACELVALAWPLDRMIAVSPYWGWIDKPFEQFSPSFTSLTGSPTHMPRAWYREQWEHGAFDRSDLSFAIKESHSSIKVDHIIAALYEEAPSYKELPLISDVIDEERDDVSLPSWRTAITNQISRFCSAYFDRYQADWRVNSDKGLYSAWRENLLRDHGFRYVMNAQWLKEKIQQLPHNANALIADALIQLGLEDTDYLDLLTATLFRINGWAAWCAYLRWQAQLDKRSDNHLVELLAVRLAWEILLDDGNRSDASRWSRWYKVWLDRPLAYATSTDKVAFLCHRAMEFAYQNHLAQQLLIHNSRAQSSTPTVQAVFCIDVRSEIFRRALEKVDPSIQTRGFAGFFGLPVSYLPLGGKSATPQLPGLLAPKWTVTETTGDQERDAQLMKERGQLRSNCQTHQPFKRLPSSSFNYVETLGMSYLWKLIRASFHPKPSCRHALSKKFNTRLEFSSESNLGFPEKVNLVEGILRAMNLTRDFARLVVLVGHGSQSTNNPHAASLDCGACGGQTGEVNSRVLAQLLNDPQVRHQLRERSINIPSTTYFVAALHNTTTDEVQIADNDWLPHTHHADLVRLKQLFQCAGDSARAERATRLDIASDLSELGRQKEFQNRSRDWAQTRQEWGLANNVAMVVAKRTRTSHLNLQGRVFLHEYEWQSDERYQLLETIMTAPMIVAHWINMQYFGSTVDNTHFGSGNKLLHNVVAGTIGVLEGNGGDLRIGLPMQSLHDGARWMHTPLRLSVFIEAPRHRIEWVMANHDVVRNLVHHGWIYLFRIDSSMQVVERYCSGTQKKWELFVHRL